MICLRDISLRFGEQAVLDSINWEIPPKSRVALVGENGAGKSTLLRIMYGQTEQDSGTVSMPAGWTVGYLPQDLVELGDGTVMDYLRTRSGISLLEERIRTTEENMSRFAEGTPELRAASTEHDRLMGIMHYRGGFAFGAQARRVLSGLGFGDDAADRSCATYSGGWKMRVLLAANLLAAPDVLLMDEPTNHLDTESMEWLEGYLRDYEGTLIFVSHDRRFLNSMSRSIADLSGGKLTAWSYGYEAFIRAKEEAKAQLEAAREAQAEEIVRVQGFIERFRYKATKAAQVQSRIKMLEKLDILPDEQYSRTVNIKFPEAPRCAYDVLKASGLAKRYGSNSVFSGIDLTIHRGERVALVGVNGAGKSTLLRLLNQSEEPSGGAVIMGNGVKKGYFSQESAQNLCYSRTIWEEVTNTGSKLNEQERRNLLGAFLFSGEQIHKPAGVLSGGEKSRVALLKLLLSDNNLLILDEPTNHLDQSTVELFQKALLSYSGTVLIVSHDRYFLDSLAERVLEIREHRMKDYPGNYSYFIRKRSEEIQETDTRAKTQAPQEQSKKRTEAEERNRIYRLKKAVQEKITPLEARIGCLETRQVEIEASLCDPATLSDSVAVQEMMKELKSTKTELQDLYPRWESLAEELEAIE